jgi:hypothetical protein
MWRPAIGSPAPSHHRLHRPTTRRGQDRPRDPPLHQALPRPPLLPTPTQQRRHTPTCPRYAPLTPVEASCSMLIARRARAPSGADRTARLPGRCAAGLEPAHRYGHLPVSRTRRRLAGPRSLSGRRVRSRERASSDWGYCRRQTILPAYCSRPDDGSTLVTMHVPYLVSIGSPSAGGSGSSATTTSSHVCPSIVTMNRCNGRSSAGGSGGCGRLSGRWPRSPLAAADGRT